MYQIIIRMSSIINSLTTNSIANMRLYRFAWIFFLCLSTEIALGQGSVLTNSYYYCDFEDDTENANWQLNTPKNESATWSHLWYIGSAAARDGEKSMYISADNGVSTGYTVASRIMIAWREFNALETGTYDIAFDWRNVGDTLAAVLHVAWVPEDYFDDMNCAQNNNINNRKWITENLITVDNNMTTSVSLFGSSTWERCLGKVKVENNTRYRLRGRVWIISK